MNGIIRLIVVVVTVTWCAVAWATPDLLVPYQKQLPATPAPGTGNVTFTLTLWDAETGGTAVWTEIKVIPMTVSRVLTTKLGDTPPGSLAAVDFSKQLWVQVANNTGATVYGARDKLIIGPYAFWSKSVADGAVTAAKLSDMGAASGQLLGFTNGSWGPVNAGGAGTVTSVALSGGTTGLQVTGSPVTTSGTFTLYGTLDIANGGTGQTTAAAAFNALAPSQSGNSGKFLTTDGAVASWGTATSLPAPSWTVLSGTSQTAVSGNAYLTTNAAQTTVTLPASPAAGNVVRVMASSGSGGWRVNAAGTQTLAAPGIGSGAWTQRTPTGNVQAVASSSDGAKLAAVVKGGYIYTSNDSGVTWTARMADASRQWNSIASNSDGTKLAAVVQNGYIYTSNDSGVTWTAQMTDVSRQWYSIASSSDGVKLAAVVCSSSSNGYIYTSTNSGVTWTARMTDANRYWWSIASSSDGVTLAAVINSSFTNGYIYTSTDSGVTWTARMTDAMRQWSGIAVSSDGAMLAAVVYNGRIYTSTDGGAIWTQQTGASGYWYCIASSADGSHLAAVAYNDYIYVSSDGGYTWAAKGSSATWQAIASSNDGTRLVAGTSGSLYTSPDPTTLLGAARSGADFLYDGVSQWLLVNTQGTLTVP